MEVPTDATNSAEHTPVRDSGAVVGDSSDLVPEPDSCPLSSTSTACEALEVAAGECLIDVSNDVDCTALDETESTRECARRCVRAECSSLCPIPEMIIAENPPTLAECFTRCLYPRPVFCPDQVVPSLALCDGVNDCAGGEDERGEACVVPDPDFTCNGEYSPFRRYQVCDGSQHCSRGDDEPCPESFDCIPCACADDASNQCPPYIACSAEERMEVTVGAEQLLDGTADCPFGEDEHLPEQLSCRTQGREEWCEELLNTTTGYLCQGTDTRIPRRDVCNGAADCPEGDDEPCSSLGQVCPEQHELVATFLASRGTEDVMGVVIALEDDLLCEPGTAPEDCPFLSCDESGCYFPCANGQLIRPEQVANGAFNCPGGEDEPCAPAFECDDRTERIPFDLACNGVTDCGDGSDETECPKTPEPFICADGRQVVFRATRCGARCDDLSDLVGCNPVD